ncbi:MAG: plasmid pRiA4b ORF-3 family protein [Methanosarcinaceae archaeon]
MKSKFDRVYQYKITLAGIKPPIWRRIQVPETYTFWDLHVAIQDAMGWLDRHLHIFLVVDPSTNMRREIGTPTKMYDEYDETIPGWEHKIADYFSLKHPKTDYEYDFGDSWGHKIQLEKILPREKGIDYPVCIKGKRACPPEDCGGVWGYKELLEAIKDPKHDEHREMLEWVGGDLDPEHFDVKEVRFDDPGKRLKEAME